jgi:translation initiation factor 1
VTLVTGIEGDESRLLALAKRMKTACGAGGTVKEGAIEIQGDHVEKVQALLAVEGYRPKK